MATLQTLQERTDAAIAALDAGEYANAIRHCDAALLILATTPDSQFDVTDQIRFDRQGATSAIKQVMANARAQLAAQAPSYERMKYARH